MAGKNEQEVSAYSFEAYVDEVKVVAMNTTEFSSKVFDSLTRDWLDGRKIKALMPFCIMPGGKVRFSLYECVEDSVDCCEVSKRFGGGGHTGAAGFVIECLCDEREGKRCDEREGGKRGLCDEREGVKEVYVMRERGKEVMRERVKEVYVMRERG